MRGEAFDPEAIDWSLTTWKGSRVEQLRRWRQLSFDEILAAQESMAEWGERKEMQAGNKGEGTAAGWGGEESAGGRTGGGGEPGEETAEGR